ncbi:hypothetical protein Chor_015115, partial [Crotalus horridus]
PNLGLVRRKCASLSLWHTLQTTTRTTSNNFLAFSFHSISNKELTELIEKLQKNADQVEKNIVETDSKMQSETLNSKGFGTDLPSVNSQVEEHNIFHNEVMAIGPHINKEGEKEYTSELQMKYQKLLSESQRRQENLNLLQDFMQRCTNKLYWLDQQAKDRLQFDWSDQNLDYPSRRRQYENFINRKLEEKEAAINKLHEDGNKLLSENHPGKIAIEAHIEAVHADWKEYLNLLICEESHLKFMEDYHQFQKDAKDAQELLRKVDTDLDQKYSPEFKDRYQIETLLHDLEATEIDQEKALDKYEDVVSSLQKRSQQVLPLKYRREPPLKPIPGEALCDYENEQCQILRGGRYTLHKNNEELWEVTDSGGNAIKAPGVCFMIPPTDPESLTMADNIASHYQCVKQKTACTKNRLEDRYNTLKAESIGDAASVQIRQLLAELEKVNSELDKQEKAITANLRPPLEQSRAVQDSAERSIDLKNVTNQIHRIEPEKTSKIQECEALIESMPESSSTTLVKSKVEETNNKYNWVTQLLNAAQEKVDVANHLEKVLQQGRDLLSGYENKLAIEDTIPEDVHALEHKREELMALNSELQVQQLLNEAHQDLEKAKKCSSTLASQFQEHCPDIERQEAELHKLNQRFSNLNKQLDYRSQVLQKAKSAYSNYRAGYDGLKHYFENIPNYEPQENDHISQVETKLKKQQKLLEEIASKDKEVQKVSSEAQQYQQAVKQPDLQMVEESIQISKSKKPLEEIWKLKKELDDETQSRQHLEEEIKVIQQNIFQLQNQKPQEIVLRKEVVKKVPDPELDENYHKMQQNLADEQSKNQELQEELEALKQKLGLLEHEKREGGQEYVVKEVLRIEPDKAQAEEILKLKEELEELKRQEGNRQNEMALLYHQIATLSNERIREQERVTEKAVVKMQNDPQLEMEYKQLQENKQRESMLRHQQEEELRFLQDKLRRLEKERAMAEGKLTVKEVLKVEKDVATEREVNELRRQYEEEKAKARLNEREKGELLRKIQALEEENATVIVQEKVREIIRPDPQAENEVANLRFEMMEQERRYLGGEEQLRACQNELATLKSRGPRVEVQEIIKEVIKYKTDPETETEMKRLRNEIVDRTRAIERADLEIYKLKQEIEALKEAKPHIQVKEVLQEILQYREDRQKKEEVESLRAQLVEEQKKHMDLEKEKKQQEEIIRQKEEELSQVREKVIKQEVVKLEQDPTLKSEINTFSQNIENELQQIDSLRTEMRKLQRRRSQLERQLEELEKERQARREAELEVQRLKIRLSELEQQEKDTTEKVTVRQKVIVQQDPQQEKEHSLLKLELEEEKHKKQVLQTELEALRKKLQALEKMGVKEKVVFSESVQVEKGDTEYEIQKLKNSLEEESRRKMQLDSDINKLEAKLSEMEFNNSKSSKELDFLREENHKLHIEKQNLLLEMRRLHSEIELTTMEAQDLKNMAQVDRRASLDLRFHSLENELEDLKRLSQEKDEEIEQLQTRLQTVAIKREQRENHLRRSIVVIDPDTGKEMSPEEAHRYGLIDWSLYVKLKSQECDWEEITVKGPSGESSVILDRKSGRKFCIEDALKHGRLTMAQYQSYLNKEMSIQELAVLVSGQK